jgi:hypothetical protein
MRTRSQCAIYFERSTSTGVLLFRNMSAGNSQLSAALLCAPFSHRLSSCAPFSHQLAALRRACGPARTIAVRDQRLDYLQATRWRSPALSVKPSLQATSTCRWCSSVPRLVGTVAVHGVPGTLHVSGRARWTPVRMLPIRAQPEQLHQVCSAAPRYRQLVTLTQAAGQFGSLITSSTHR